MLWVNLLPWGWYGEWEQDDDEAKATLERWVMGVRSRRKRGAQGPRLTRRASLELACRHLDPALGAGMRASSALATSWSWATCMTVGVAVGGVAARCMTTLGGALVAGA